MRWREILIGAFATLVATILGGIIAYYVTSHKKEERLERSVRSRTSFSKVLTAKQPWLYDDYK